MGISLGLCLLFQDCSNSTHTQSGRVPRLYDNSPQIPQSTKKTYRFIEALIFNEKIDTEVLLDTLQKFEEVQSLIIRNNPELEFSKIIQQLTQLILLEELALEACDLEELPEGIGFIKGLKKLSLFTNSIKKLPPSLSNLQHLEDINLCFNPNGLFIEYNLKILSQIPILKKLGICYGTDKLPSIIGQFKSLEELDLTSHGIKEFPATIAQLKKLKILRMSGGMLQKLPDEIGQMESLEEIYAQNNQIRAIPLSIKDLKNLRLLNLEHNQIQSLPDFTNVLLSKISLTGNPCCK